MLCPRSAVPDRPEMHDNVCKAVVEGVCVFGRTLTVGVIDWGHGADDMSLNSKMPLSQAASRFLHRQIIVERFCVGQQEPCAQYGSRLTSTGVSPPQSLHFTFLLFALRRSIQAGMFLSTGRFGSTRASDDGDKGGRYQTLSTWTLQMHAGSDWSSGLSGWGGRGGRAIEIECAAGVDFGAAVEKETWD
jgi:hypothetical protein